MNNTSVDQSRQVTPANEQEKSGDPVQMQIEVVEIDVPPAVHDARILDDQSGVTDHVAQYWRNDKLVQNGDEENDKTDKNDKTDQYDENSERTLEASTIVDSSTYAIPSSATTFSTVLAKIPQTIIPVKKSTLSVPNLTTTDRHDEVTETVSHQSLPLHVGLPDLKPASSLSASTTTVLPTKHNNAAETIRNADTLNDTRLKNNADDTNEESDRDGVVSNNTIDIGSVLDESNSRNATKKLGGHETQVEGHLDKSDFENENEARVGRQKKIFAGIKDFVKRMMTTTVAPADFTELVAETVTVTMNRSVNESAAGSVAGSVTESVIESTIEPMTKNIIKKVSESAETQNKSVEKPNEIIPTTILPTTLKSTTVETKNQAKDVKNAENKTILTNPTIPSVQNTTDQA